MACNKEPEAIVMIRFSEAVYQACKNTLTKQQMVTGSYGGKVIGLVHANDIRVIVGEWPRDKGLAMLRFPSMVDAKRWEHSTPEIRQSDWLAGVDINVSPCMCPPTSCQPFIQIMTHEDMQIDEEQGKTMATEFEKLMREHCVTRAIATKNTERLRGAWFTHMLRMNLYPCEEKFKEFGQLDCVKAVRERFTDSGYNTMIGFQLEPLN